MPGKLINRFNLFRYLSTHQSEVSVLLFRAWQAFAGLVTLFLISLFLTPQVQGIYYTFASIAALQTILDMGLSVVLVQLAAHKFLGLQWMNKGHISGDKAGAFLGFVQSAVLWYGLATLLFMLIYPLGLWFFQQSPDVLGLTMDWKQVWFYLVLFTGLNLLLQPLLSVIEGSGQIVETYRVRLLQTVLGAAAAWGAFVSGNGLYAVFMLPLMAVVVTLVWLGLSKPIFIKSLLLAGRAGFSWGKEVWPLQWRIGTSWISGYFLTQLYTPILFKTQGAVAAGQIGLSITVINMLGLIALSTMTAKVPRMAQLASNHQHTEVDGMFRRGLTSSLLLYFAGGLTILAVLYMLADTKYHVRFLPLPEFLLLMLAILAANVVNAFAMFFRAYRQERLMWLYVANAVLASSFAYFIAPSWGSTGVVGALFLINIVLILPIALLLWSRFRLSLTKL